MGLKVARRKAQRAAGKKPREKGPKAPEIGPKASSQVSLADEESRTLFSPDGFIQGYNSQAPERKAILDAISPLAEKDLKQPINFAVRALPVADD